MSLDFAVIGVDFHTAEEALQRCDALYDEPGDPPAAVAGLLEDLDRIDAFGDDGFLSIWPADTGAHGVVLCTRWPQWDRSIHTLLGLTRDRGLAMVDVQQRQVFDPRGAATVDAVTANRTRLPYLTESIVRDVMDRQAHYGDHLVVETAPDTYIQSLYLSGVDCEVEYRDGSADRHFQTRTADRSLVPRLIAAWLRDGPHAGLLRAQRWERLAF